MRGRSTNSIAANPVLVGAITTLVVIIAVFLAYNANNGLPFVPTRELYVQVSNGAELVKGNEVRMGGFRVGVVDQMTPVRLPDGTVGARLRLKLDEKLGAIPVDSRVVIRPRSALGLKFVELDLGRSKKTFRSGDTLPQSQSSVPVELDQVYDTFDAKTRKASQDNLVGFGDALAGRGDDLNRTIQVAPALFGHLADVMANLSLPATHLKDFFRSLDVVVDEIAPVSAIGARTFTTAANTFAAISADPKALEDTIAKSPGTLAEGTTSFRDQRPFLNDTARFSVDLSAATHELRAALPDIDTALEVGTPVTKRTVAQSQELQSALGALRDLVRAPTTVGSLRGLTAAVATLQPQARFLGPYVTVCNSWNAFWTFAAEHLSSPTSTGTQQRALLNETPQVPPSDNDSLGSDNANEFAHDESKTSPGIILKNAFLGDAVTPNGDANCQAGQQGYPYASNPYRDKTVPGDPYKQAVVDKPLGGTPRVGPTFKSYDHAKGTSLNVDHVPAGETFTASPGGTAAPTVGP